MNERDSVIKGLQKELKVLKATLAKNNISYNLNKFRSEKSSFGGNKRGPQKTKFRSSKLLRIDDTIFDRMEFLAEQRNEGLDKRSCSVSDLFNEAANTFLEIEDVPLNAKPTKKLGGEREGVEL